MASAMSVKYRYTPFVTSLCMLEALIAIKFTSVNNLNKVTRFGNLVHQSELTTFLRLRPGCLTSTSRLATLALGPTTCNLLQACLSI
jgi:hypothetical protein